MNLILESPVSTAAAVRHYKKDIKPPAGMIFWSSDTKIWWAQINLPVSEAIFRVHFCN